MKQVCFHLCLQFIRNSNGCTEHGIWHKTPGQILWGKNLPRKRSVKWKQQWFLSQSRHLVRRGQNCVCFCKKNILYVTIIVSLFLSAEFIAVQPHYSKGHHHVWNLRQRWTPWNRRRVRYVKARYDVHLKKKRILDSFPFVSNKILPLTLFVPLVSHQHHHHLPSKAHEEQVQIHRGDATNEEGEQKVWHACLRVFHPHARRSNVTCPASPHRPFPRKNPSRADRSWRMWRWVVCIGG